MSDSPSSAVDVAKRLATALDAEDYWAARIVLAPGCRYTNGPDGTITGADVILQSYRSHGAIVNPRFDEIVFGSEVEPAGDNRATIRYLDRLRLGEAWHDHYCLQHITVGEDGLITHIRHEDIPGEVEALRAFEAEHRAQK